MLRTARCSDGWWKEADITREKIIGLVRNGADCGWKDKRRCYLAGIKTELMSEKNSQGTMYFSGSFSISQLCVTYSRSGSWSEEESNYWVGGCFTKFPAKKVQVRNSFLKLRRHETPYTLILLQLFLTRQGEILDTVCSSIKGSLGVSA